MTLCSCGNGLLAGVKPARRDRKTVLGTGPGLDVEAQPFKNAIEAFDGPGVPADQSK